MDPVLEKPENELGDVSPKPEIEKSPDTSVDPSISTEKRPDNFSSENFKISIHNLPKYCGAKELKKYMKSLEFDVRKAYVVKDHGYVCFSDESSVARALTVLQNRTWKKNVLRVKRAAANIDPVLAASNAKKSKIKSDLPEDESATDGAETESPEVRLLDAVAPLHKLSYADQLAKKDRESEQLLKEISRSITTVAGGDQAILPASGYFGELKSILPSPIVDGYRNKCEFSIGYDSERRPTIGFRLTRYKAGNTEIVSPEGCPHVPEMTKRIVSFLQKFIVDSQVPPYDVATRVGFWTMLTVRQFHMDTLVIVTVYQRETSEETVNSMKKALVDLFSSTTNDGFRVTSLYFSRLERSSDAVVYEHLWGAPYVYENLLGLRFRISPGAFFQVNTPACEVLYKRVSDICEANSETLIVDLCCGTGTIGIVVAAKAGKVIGIELIAEAVEDARINAKNNERENCEFICGRVENVIDDIRRRTNGPLAQFKRIIGILDPPRGGLPGKVLSNIRQFQAMKTVIYVSCDPKAASKNFLDLTRRASNRYPGEAFRLKTVQPVDLFPYTKHCEWILVFER